MFCKFDPSRRVGSNHRQYTAVGHALDQLVSFFENGEVGGELRVEDFFFGKSVLGGFAFLLVVLSLQRWEWGGMLLMIAGAYTLERKPNQKIFELFKIVLISRDHFYIFGAHGLFAVSSVVGKALVSNYRVDPLVVLFCSISHAFWCLARHCGSKTLPR